MFRVKVCVNTLLRDETGKKVEVKKGDILETSKYSTYISWMQYASMGRIIEIKDKTPIKKEVKKEQTKKEIKEVKKEVIK